MKILMFIIGAVFALAGLGLTGYVWYAASAEGHIYADLAYPGPFLLIVGAWRILASGMAAAPSALRIVAVLIGIGAGYGNVQVLKAAFPNDHIIASASHPTTPNN
jgi:hypothetical protein